MRREENLALISTQNNDYILRKEKKKNFWADGSEKIFLYEYVDEDEENLLEQYDKKEGVSGQENDYQIVVEGLKGLRFYDESSLEGIVFYDTFDIGELDTREKDFYFVLPKVEDTDWEIYKIGNDKASKVESFFFDAKEKAKELKRKNDNSHFFIIDRNGKIEEL